MKNYIINNYNNLVRNSNYILKKYKSNVHVLELSKLYDISPLTIMRFIFKKLYNKKLTTNFENINNHDNEQLQIAIQNDIFSPIEQVNTSDEAIAFEKKIETNILIKNKIKYKTQEELTIEQIKKYDKAINTPDFLILSDFYINGNKINWIDAKNFYGSNVPFVVNKIKKQVKKYIDSYGSGCIIFNLGFNDSFKISNIFITCIQSF